MGKHYQPEQQQYQQQQYQQQQRLPQEQLVIDVPPNAAANQDMVLIREEPATVGSKFKSFFKRDKKKKLILSEKDAEILRQVKRRARILDTGLDIGCARVGIDPIIGLIPVAGDVVTMLLALQLVYTAQKADIPKSLTQQMLFNVALDFGIGLVPVLGDFADFLFKCNDKNAKIFEAFLFERAAAQAAEEEAAALARARVAVPPATAPAALNHDATHKTSKGSRFFGFGRNRQDEKEAIHEQQYQQQQEQQPHQTVIEMDSVPSGSRYPIK